MPALEEIRWIVSQLQLLQLRRVRAENFPRRSAHLCKSHWSSVTYFAGSIGKRTHTLVVCIHTNGVGLLLSTLLSDSRVDLAIEQPNLLIQFRSIPLDRRANVVVFTSVREGCLFHPY